MTANRFPTRSVRIFLLVAVGLGLVSAGVTGGTEETAPVPPAPVLTARVELQASYLRGRRYVGQVEPGRRSVLGFQRLDRVVEILVEEGDSVRTGEVLARLDRRDLEARGAELRSALASAEARLRELERGPREEDVAAARAAVERARADAELAQATERRLKNALEKAAVSAQSYDEARLALESARARQAELTEILRRLENGTRVERVAAQRAEVESLAARVHHNALEIEESELTAPFDASILVRHVDEGTVVSPGQAILEILGRERLEFRLGLPRDVVDRLRRGEEYAFEVGERVVPASLYASLPERTLQARTIDVLFRTDRIDSGVRPGDMVTLLLEQSIDQEGFWIPSIALTRSLRGLWSCYVVVAADSDEIVERRELRILHEAGDRSYVTGAVRSGEVVVIAGVHRLVPGQRVAVAESVQP